VYCFLYLLCIAYFQSLSLGADFDSVQELEDQELEQQLAGNPSKSYLTMLILYGFSL
jgi:hypothetical protein